MKLLLYFKGYSSKDHISLIRGLSIESLWI
jgi:hypothetical protein